MGSRLWKGADDETGSESVLSVLNLLDVTTRQLVQCESCLLHLKTQWWQSATQATSNSKHGELQHPESFRCKNCNCNPVYYTTMLKIPDKCGKSRTALWQHILAILNRHANYQSLKDQFAFKTSTSISTFLRCKNFTSLKRPI